MMTEKLDSIETKSMEADCGGLEHMLKPAEWGGPDLLFEVSEAVVTDELIVEWELLISSLMQTVE